MERKDRYMERYRNDPAFRESEKKRYRMYYLENKGRKKIVPDEVKIEPKKFDINAWDDKKAFAYLESSRLCLK